MEKRKEIFETLEKIKDLKKLKMEYAQNQRYQDAGDTRDKEKVLLDRLDEITGVEACYEKVFLSGEILEHVTNILESTKKLKKLRPHSKEIFEDLNFDKYLLKLYRQRDEALVSMLQLKEHLGLEEKKV